MCKCRPTFESAVSKNKTKSKFFLKDPSLESSISSTSAWYHGGRGFKSRQGREFRERDINFYFKHKHKFTLNEIIIKVLTK